MTWMYGHLGKAKYALPGSSLNVEYNDMWTSAEWDKWEAVEWKGLKTIS